MVKKSLGTILIVDDEAPMRRAIAQLLVHAGYAVLEADDGPTALRLIEEERPALAVMDVNMPKMDGMVVLETIRRRGLSLPVLMLSGLGDVEHRLKGLGLGADDYMAKPFDPRELVARLGALLRRGQPNADSFSRRLQRGDLSIDFAARRAERAGQEVLLTATEYAILEVLAQNAGRPVSREYLLDVVWGYTSSANTRTVETHIWRLRKKLGDMGTGSGFIQNRQGLGYLLTVEESGATSIQTAPPER